MYVRRSLTRSVASSSLLLPEPLQREQRSLSCSPDPPHVGHVDEALITPILVRWTFEETPERRKEPTGEAEEDGTQRTVRLMP